MTNRVAAYFSAQTPPPLPEWRVYALGDSLTQVCITHSVYDAAAEADEFTRAPHDALTLFPGVRSFVVLTPEGAEYCRYEMPPVDAGLDLAAVLFWCGVAALAAVVVGSFL